MRLQNKKYMRFEALDAMRGIAAVLVALGHIMLAGVYTPLSHLAVDFFFILSGFVLAHRYFTHWDPRETVDFIWQRMFRLWPLYFLMTLLTFIYRLTTDEIDFKDANWEFFASISALDMLGFSTNSINPPSWSLSAEIIVNVFFALVLVGKKSTSLIILLFSYYIVFSSQAGIMGTHALAIGQLPVGIFRCFGGFLSGVFAYNFFALLWKPMNISSSKHTLLQILMIVLVASLAVFYYENQHSGFLFIALFFMAMPIFAEGKGLVAKLLSNPAFLYLGKISYSIYLVHYFIKYIFDDYLFVFPNQFVALISYFTITVIVSGFTYRYVEIPAQNLNKNRVENPRIFWQKVYVFCVAFLLLWITLTTITGGKIHFDERAKLARLYEKAENENRASVYNGPYKITQIQRTFLIIRPDCRIWDREISHAVISKNADYDILDRSQINTKPILHRINGHCVEYYVAPKGSTTVEFSIRNKNHIDLEAEKIEFQTAR